MRRPSRTLVVVFIAIVVGVASMAGTTAARSSAEHPDGQVTWALHITLAAR